MACKTPVEILKAIEKSLVKEIKKNNPTMRGETIRKEAFEQAPKLLDAILTPEQKIYYKMGGYIRMWAKGSKGKGTNYSIEDVTINYKDSTVKIKGKKGKEWKTYIFPFGSSHTTTANGVEMETAWLHDYTKDLQKPETLYADPTDAQKPQSPKGDVVLEGKDINSFSKLTELMDKLDNMDNVGLGESHKAHLRKVVKFLTHRLDSPLKEMNVYLNDKATENHGMITFRDDEVTDIELSVGSNPQRFSTDQSMVEKFVHELLHGPLHHGMSMYEHELSKEITMLGKLRHEVLAKLEPEDLLGENILDREVELQIAQAKLNYMIDGENGLEEFLVIALTNERIYEKLKTITLHKRKEGRTLAAGLYNMVMDFFNKLMELIGKGERTMKGDQLAMKLISDIGKLNAKVNDAKSYTLYEKVNDFIDSKEEMLVEWAEKKSDEGDSQVIEKLASRQKLSAVEKLKAVHMILASEKGTPTLQALLKFMGMKQEGFLQTIVKHLKHADAYGNTVQSLTLASGQIDMHREKIAQNVANIVNNGFGKKPLRKTQKVAMYSSMIMSDGILLMKDYSIQDMIKLYKNEDAVNTEINVIEDYLQSKLTPSDYNYMIHQARGLAELMYTGKSTIVQRKNAEAIVAHVMRVNKFEVNKDTVHMVDKLVSLYGVKSLDRTVKKTTAELFKTHGDGMKVLAEMQLGFREQLEETLSDTESYNLIKNYHRETFENEIEVVTAPRDAKTKRRMKLEGYSYAEDVDDLGLGYDNSKSLGLYISNSRIRKPLNSATLRYTGDRDQGMSLYQDASAREIEGVTYEIVQKQKEEGNKLAKKYEDSIRNGNVAEDNTRVVPVVNHKNEVVDYRTEISLKTKLKYYGLEADSAMAVARSRSHEADLAESKELNEIAWEELMKDMVENAHSTGTLGKTNYEYVDISEMSEINEIQDIARILPENIRERMSKIKKANKLRKWANDLLDEGISREQINERIPKTLNSATNYLDMNEITGEFELNDEIMKLAVTPEIWEKASNTKRDKLKRIFGKDVFKVRRDMLLDIFGVRDASLANLIPDHASTKHLKMAIRFAEDMWKEIVKIFKVDVIIRTLPVIIGNIVSNLMLSVQSGMWPWEVFKRQKAGVRYLQEYIKSSERATELEALMAAKPGDKKLKLEYQEMKALMDNSPIKDLVDSGLYQHIVDDVQMGDVRSNSRVARAISEKTEGAPEWIKTTGHWLFISEKTSLFQLVTKMTAYSDFIARYAQYTLTQEKAHKRYLKRHGKSMPAAEEQKLKEETIIRVRDAYVNYAKPDSKVLQYMNDMGLVAFSKYAIRIQLGIRDLAAHKPLRFGLAALGQELFEGITGYNPDDIGEVSVLNRDIENWVYTPGASKIIGDIIEPQAYTYLKDALH